MWLSASSRATGTVSQEAHVDEALEHARLVGVAAAAEGLERAVGGEQAGVAGGDLRDVRLDAGLLARVVEPRRRARSAPTRPRAAIAPRRAGAGSPGARRSARRRRRARCAYCVGALEAPAADADRLRGDDEPLRVEPVEEDALPLAGLADAGRRRARPRRRRRRSTGTRRRARRRSPASPSTPCARVRQDEQRRARRSPGVLRDERSSRRDDSSAEMYVFSPRRRQPPRPRLDRGAQAVRSSTRRPAR